MNLKQDFFNCSSLIILQPVLYDYRAQVLNGLNLLLPTYAIASLKTQAPACSFVDIPSRHPFLWLGAAINAYFRTSRFRIVFIPAYTSHPGILLCALFFYFSRVPILVHGQALFKKPRPSFLDILISSFWLSLSTRYLSYSSIGLDGPFDLPVYRQKVIVLLNRFESLSSLGLDSFSPNYRSFDGDNTALRLLFIGRDRPGSELSLAVQLVRDLRAKGLNIFLELIGVSSQDEDGIHCHGPLFAKSIVPVADECHIGIYPGDAGLSVLHYMALGLCPIVHGDLRMHSGPEPSYVTDGITGCLFDRGSRLSLTKTLLFLYSNPDKLMQMRVNAHSFAKQLLGYRLSDQLYTIIKSLIA
jgi:glycosyltransferase involved in cell wall biosynthesis